MSSRTFDRETLLDLTVNAIPLGIMLFFLALFVVVNPFGSNPVHTVLQFAIVGVTFVALAILTYVSGRAISRAEDELERKGYDLSEAAGAVPEEADAGAELEADEGPAPELEADDGADARAERER